MSEKRETSSLLGLVGVGMVVCCGLPVLLAGGIAIGVAGVALGSGFVVAAGVVLAVWGWRRRRSAHCEVPSADPGRVETLTEPGPERPP
jgi:Flp pilus assembly protein TadB